MQTCMQICMRGLNVHSLQSMRGLERVDACRPIQFAEYAQAGVGGCMYTVCRVCAGLSGGMHVHSLQSMRGLEWVCACTQLAEYAQA